MPKGKYLKIYQALFVRLGELKIRRRWLAVPKSVRAKFYRGEVCMLLVRREPGICQATFFSPSLPDSFFDQKNGK